MSRYYLKMFASTYAVCLSYPLSQTSFFLFFLKFRLGKPLWLVHRILRPAPLKAGLRYFMGVLKNPFWQRGLVQ
jgi:hypothetical protein